MDEKQHIVLISSRLDQPGGAERAIVNLANLLDSKGHRVILLVLDETAESFYTINPSVLMIQKNLNFGISEKGNKVSRKLDFYRHIQQLKKLLRQLHPDIVIGTEYHFSIASWLAVRKLPIRVFTWEHHHIHWLRKSRFWSLLFRKIYPQLDAVVCQNEREKKLHEAFGCNAYVIPNSVPLSGDELSTLEQKQILTIGWLINRKGVDLIPSIAEKVLPSHPDWKWKLIGNGPEQDSLRKKILEKGLSSQLIIEKPVSQDLRQVYLGSSIYVMTSRFECLPMVLLEAISYGIPCIAFDCPTGPADIIHNGEDGILVPLEEVENMAGAVNELINDREKRMRLGEQAFLQSKRYRPDRIYLAWKELFDGNE